MDPLPPDRPVLSYVSPPPRSARRLYGQIMKWVGVVLAWTGFSGMTMWIILVIWLLFKNRINADGAGVVLPAIFFSVMLVGLHMGNVGRRMLMSPSNDT